MKKNILLLTFAVLFTIAAKAQVSVDLRAGFNYQNITGKDVNGNALENKVIPCYNLGALVNIPVSPPDFFLQTGLVFETKGAKVTDIYMGKTRVRKMHLNYLQVPFNFLYKPLLGTGHLMLGFGPYVAYGMGGRVITEGVNPDEKVVWQNTVSTSETGHAYFKPFEMGANFLFGYQFSNHIQIQFNAQLGLTEINPVDARTANDKTSWKNSGFGISLGYGF